MRKAHTGALKNWTAFQYLGYAIALQGFYQQHRQTQKNRIC
jgi:hypothetical protein